MFNKIASTIVPLSASFLLASIASATVVTADFSGYASGTAITSQVEGLEFSLIGGPGPTTAPTTNGSLLTNSVYSGSYPTANILSVRFEDLASSISFVFNPEGYCYGTCGSPGRGNTYYSAFDLTGNLLETGLLGAVTGGREGTFSVAASGVHELQFNNGTNGLDSWWFGLRSLSADVLPASVPGPVSVPEPGSIALFSVALLGVAAARRRKA